MRAELAAACSPHNMAMRVNDEGILYLYLLTRHAMGVSRMPVEQFPDDVHDWNNFWHWLDGGCAAIFDDWQPSPEDPKHPELTVHFA